MIPCVAQCSSYPHLPHLSLSPSHEAIPGATTTHCLEKLQQHSRSNHKGVGKWPGLFLSSAHVQCLPGLCQGPATSQSS